MRLWTLHPRYLDSKGLVALWREALLARAVLLGNTRGYQKHPQLVRFRAHTAPVDAVNVFLNAVYAEACARGYTFDQSKLDQEASAAPIPATTGQIACEWAHLLRKLAVRSPALLAQWQEVTAPECHPLFQPVAGDVEPWERQPGAVR